MTLLKEFLSLSDIPNILYTIGAGGTEAFYRGEMSPPIPTEKEQKHEFNKDISLMFKCICRNFLVFSHTLH